MRVMITGGTGFTGRHVAALLQQAGHDVATLSPLPADLPYDHLQCDLQNGAQLRKLLQQWRPSHLLHLAAISHVVGEATDFYRVNIVYTLNLVKAIISAEIGSPRLIVASTANVYGNSTASPISEEAKVAPVNDYGVSKAGMEIALRVYSKSLPIVITRPFNYTGPGQSERFVYAKIAAAFGRKQSTLTLGNIDVSRDLSDVRDVSRVYIRLLDTAPAGTTVNICSGISVSLREVIEMLERQTGHRLKIEIDQALLRPNDIKQLTGDTSRLHSLLGDFDRTPLARTLSDMVAEHLSAEAG